jgi:hypothetical protein
VLQEKLCKKKALALFYQMTTIVGVEFVRTNIFQISENRFKSEKKSGTDTRLRDERHPHLLKTKAHRREKKQSDRIKWASPAQVSV